MPGAGFEACPRLLFPQKTPFKQSMKESIKDVFPNGNSLLYLHPGFTCFKDRKVIKKALQPCNIF